MCACLSSFAFDFEIFEVQVENGADRWEVPQHGKGVIDYKSNVPVAHYFIVLVEEHKKDGA